MVERGLALSDLDIEQAVERLAVEENIEFLDALKVVIRRGLDSSV